MPDLFSTDTLIGVVENLKVPGNTLLSAFFPRQVVADTEEIHFDVIDAKRRVAPFVSPLVAGKVVEGVGRTTKTFAPAYIKDKRVFAPNRAVTRAIGERLGGGDYTPEQRMELLVAQDLEDQATMLRRRMELMALEALTSGQVTVEGDLYPSTVVDFGRNSSLEPAALSSTARWGESAAKPLTNLRTWAALTQQHSGVYCRDVIMDGETLEKFVNDPTVEKKLDLRHVDNVGLNVDQSDDEGLAYIGAINGFRIWAYSGWYVNDAASEVVMMPSGKIIMASTRIEGVQAHGAIKDHDSLAAVPYHVKSWLQEDPSVRFLLMQSAPLVVPTRPNASLCVQVHG